METLGKGPLYDPVKECNEWIYSFVVNDPGRMKKISDPELFKLLLRNLRSEYYLDDDNVREISSFVKDFIRRRNEAIRKGEWDVFENEYKFKTEACISEVNGQLSETLMYDPEDDNYIKYDYDPYTQDPYSQYLDQDRESEDSLMEE